MLKNKKGFTLIELLAVIIILAIILSITTVFIVKIINDAKRGAFKNSAYGLMKSAENKYFSNALKGEEKKLISEYQNFLFFSGEKLDFKGTTPKEGIIAVLKGKVGLAITNGKWCAKKEYNDSKITIIDYMEGECVFDINNENDNGGGEVTEFPEEYVWATDDDFEFVSSSNQKAYFNAEGTQGYFSYIGTDEYVIIPHIIQEVSMTSYYKMFRETAIKKVYSDNLNITDMSEMFAWNEDITTLNVEYLDTSNVVNMNEMFAGTSVETLDLSSFDTTNVTDMSWMFDECLLLSSLNLSSFNTPHLNDVSYMFSNCKNITSLDLSNFDTSNVTDMSGMFYLCENLTSLNVNHFNTTSATNMSWMFYHCSSLSTLDVSNFNTFNVTDMSGMFSACENLTSLNVSNFNTSNVTNMRSMFVNCENLTSLNVNHFNTFNVTEMSSMFSGLDSLSSLDLSNFNTSNVEDMSYMFSFSNVILLDLSSFNTSNVIYTNNMFYKALTSIGYAKTQADANKFNDSSNKPEGLEFVVKPLD